MLLRRLQRLQRLAPSRAFSLIELLVVILVLGVLIAVAVPAYLGQKEKAQDSATRQYLTVAYKAAKAEAAGNESAQGSYPTPASTLRARLAAAEPGLVFSLGQYCSNAAGANAEAVVVDSDDTNGSTLKIYGESDSGKIFQLTASSTGAPSVIRACSAPVVAGASGAPQISGTKQVGQQLTVSNGTNWESDAPLTYSYQWQNCGPGGADCQDVAGAVAQSYVVQASDEGDQLRARVTAANVTGSQSQETAKTSQVLPAPPTAQGTGPTVSGTYQEGMVLTANAGSWGGTPPITYSYQWQRCGATLASCQDISGQTAQSYTLTAADVDSHIVAVVFATNAGGTSSARSDDGDPASAPTVSSAVPVGLVAPYAGQSVPAGWLEADGSCVSSSTYSDLATVAGSSYGSCPAGQFKLPDLRGRFPLGKAASGTGATLGASGGSLDMGGGTQSLPATGALSFTTPAVTFSAGAVAAQTPPGFSYSVAWHYNYWGGESELYGMSAGSGGGLSSDWTTFSMTPKTATGTSVTPTVSLSTATPAYRVLRYIVKGSPSASMPACAVWPSARATTPAGAQAADGSAASGSVSPCLDASFSGQTPDLRGRFPLGKAASGTGSTLNSAGGQRDFTHTVTRNVPASSVTIPNHSQTLTVPGGNYPMSYSWFRYGEGNGTDVWTIACWGWGSGGSNNHGVPTYPSPNNACLPANATTPAVNVSASGGGGSATTQAASDTTQTAAYNPAFLALNYYTGAASPAPGTLAPYAGVSAPSGWLAATGDCVSEATYAALFAAIGSTYGSCPAGQFKLPNLQGRFPLGKAASGTGSSLGQTGGQLDIIPSATLGTFTVSFPWNPSPFSFSVPARQASVSLVGAAYVHEYGGGSQYGLTSNGTYTTGAFGATSFTATAQGGTQTVTSSPTGATTATFAAENPPYQVLSYIIKD